MKRQEGARPRQTRIVATIGLCGDVDFPTFLQKLSEAGADVLRLNMSHADADYAKERQILQWANQPIASLHAPAVCVMADLQGPKSRIGRVPGDGIELTAGRQVVLAPDDCDCHAEAGLLPDGTLPPMIPLPEPLGRSVMRSLHQLAVDRPGLRPSVLFGDGDIVVEIISLGVNHALGIVVAGGVLGSRKGITIREIDVDLDPFPEKDQRDLEFCLDHGVDYVALSFVRSAADIERVRTFIRNYRTTQGKLDQLDDVRIVAKIETLAAIEHIDSILDASDGIMIARGDLGLQLGVEEVPMVQKQLIAAARRHGKPAIVATQMLESMIANPAPTRAEATDVFNAIVDGGDAVMLSGETSVGLRPYLVVTTMDRLARKAETWCREQSQTRGDRRAPHGMERYSPSEAHIQRINDAFAYTAVQFAEHLPARAIVCFTRTGRTPERLSHNRPTVPLLAFCSNERVARQQLLFYGLHPILLKDFDADKQKLAHMVAHARVILREQYNMLPGDAIVVTAGIDWPKGGTNALQVLIEDHKAASASTLASDGSVNTGLFALRSS